MAVSALALPVACAGPDAHPVVEGERCGGPIARCAGDGSILICQDREWVEHDCDEVCAQEGAVASGCSIQGWTDECVCDPVESECGGISPTCESADVLLTCVEGQWEPTSCAEECGSQDPPLSSSGCRRVAGGADCVCSLDGTPCGTPGAWCESGSSLARCDGGTWMVETCNQSCPVGEDPVCLPFDADEATCGCG